jgi:hypothetical protein
MSGHLEHIVGTALVAGSLGMVAGAWALTRLAELAFPAPVEES